MSAGPLQFFFRPLEKNVSPVIFDLWFKCTYTTKYIYFDKLFGKETASYFPLREKYRQSVVSKTMTTGRFLRSRTSWSKCPSDSSSSNLCGRKTRNTAKLQGPNNQHHSDQTTNMTVLIKTKLRKSDLHRSNMSNRQHLFPLEQTRCMLSIQPWKARKRTAVVPPLTSQIKSCSILDSATEQGCQATTHVTSEQNNIFAVLLPRFWCLWAEPTPANENKIIILITNKRSHLAAKKAIWPFVHHAPPHTVGGVLKY